MSKDYFNILSGDDALAASVEGRINLIYAYTGSGKTHFELTATQEKKVLYVDIENAVGKVFQNIPEHLKRKENLNTWKPKSIQDLLDFIDSDLAENYDLLVIDSLTFLADQELGIVTDAGSKLTFNHYGDLGQNIQSVLRRAQLRGINLDIVMQAERIDTEDGSQKYFPRAAGKMIVPAVIERADNIIFLTVENGENVAHCSPSDKYLAKHRDPLPDRIEKKDLNYAFLSSHFAKYKVSVVSENQIQELKRVIELSSDLKKKLSRDPVDVEKLLKFVGAKSMEGMKMIQYEKALEAIINQVERDQRELESVTLEQK